MTTRIKEREDAANIEVAEAICEMVGLDPTPEQWEQTVTIVQALRVAFVADNIDVDAMSPDELGEWLVARVRSLTI